MIGKIVIFETEIKCEEYIQDGRHKDTKMVQIEGVIIDKYRGSAHRISDIRDIFNYALVDFYLIKSNDEFFHVLPKNLIREI